MFLMTGNRRLVLFKNFKGFGNTKRAWGRAKWVSTLIDSLQSRLLASGMRKVDCCPYYFLNVAIYLINFSVLLLKLLQFLCCLESVIFEINKLQASYAHTGTVLFCFVLWIRILKLIFYQQPRLYSPWRSPIPIAKCFSL